MPTQIESMRIVARRLEPLGVPFAFLGGAVLGLLVDHPELMEIRPTKDVDVIVEVVTHNEYYTMEEKLRAAGFQHDISEGAPICRWIVDGCRVDVMPIRSTALGMNSNWFPEAIQLSRLMKMGEGCSARVITPALFIATKLEAFKDRGKRDFYASHDFEDIITVTDGRAAIVDDVAAAPENVRAFIAEAFTGFLNESDFHNALPGHLSAFAGAKQRTELVKQRVVSIASLR